MLLKYKTASARLIRYMKESHMMPAALVAFVLFAIIVIAAYLYIRKTSAPVIVEPVACTMEAKMCPDGSYVGRTGPNCEFSACPN